MLGPHPAHLMGQLDGDLLHLVPRDVDAQPRPSRASAPRADAARSPARPARPPARRGAPRVDPAARSPPSSTGRSAATPPLALRAPSAFLRTNGTDYSTDVRPSRPAPRPLRACLRTNPPPRRRETFAAQRAGPGAPAGPRARGCANQGSASVLFQRPSYGGQGRRGSPAAGRRLGWPWGRPGVYLGIGARAAGHPPPRATRRGSHAASLSRRTGRARASRGRSAGRRASAAPRSISRGGARGSLLRRRPGPGVSARRCGSSGGRRRAGPFTGRLRGVAEPRRPVNEARGARLPRGRRPPCGVAARCGPSGRPAARLAPSPGASGRPVSCQPVLLRRRGGDPQPPRPPAPGLAVCSRGPVAGRRGLSPISRVG